MTARIGGGGAGASWCDAEPTEGRSLSMSTGNPDFRCDNPPSHGTRIALCGVSRIHDGGAIAALRNVDLDIRAGDCIAIVGASGSGKSSLMNLLCGIDYPSSGSVLWNGQPVRGQAQWARARRTSIGT